MKKIKVGILVQQAFAQRFEAQALFNKFKSIGFETYLLHIEDITFEISNTPVIKSPHIDLPELDVILFREVFRKMKAAIMLARYLKTNSNVLVIDNNLSTEQFLVNKVREGLTLKAAGLPFPKTFYALTLEQYLNNLEYIESFLGYPLLVKHNSAGKGAKIYKVDSREELVDKIKQINAEDPKKAIKRYHLQEFLNLKADYRVLVVGRKVVGAMQRIPKEGEFRANFSLGGSVKPVELTPELKSLAERATQAVNSDFAGVDVVYTTENKPYILEVNRTPGFEGFTKAHKIDVPQLFVDYILQKLKEKRQY